MSSPPPVGEPTFTLHKLRVFREVAERQSATLAARALFVTQPVISGHVHDLERFFGAQLFFRSGRRMQLTEAGETVLAYAKEVVRNTAQTATTVRLQQTGEAGRVLVAGSETPGSYRLPEWLADFRLQHPTAEIALEVLGADEICERVRHGQYDFAVVAPLESPRRLHVEVLYEEPLVIVCSPRHALAHQARVDRETIGELPFVSHTDRPTDWLDGRLRLFGLEEPRIALSVGTTEGVKLAVRTGVGIAAVFRSSVERELSRGELVEIEVTYAAPRRAIYLVHDAAKRFSPLQAGVLQYVRRRAQAEQLTKHSSLDIVS